MFNYKIMCEMKNLDKDSDFLFGKNLGLPTLARMRPRMKCEWL